MGRNEVASTSSLRSSATSVIKALSVAASGGLLVFKVSKRAAISVETRFRDPPALDQVEAADRFEQSRIVYKNLEFDSCCFRPSLECLKISEILYTDEISWR